MRPAFMVSGGREVAPVSHVIRGVVEHGDARGRKIGFPTANLKVPEAGIRDGVWAGSIQIGSDGGEITYAAAVSVGRRPTYYREGERLLEVHLLDYAGILYGKELRVSLHLLVRGQRRFADSEELIAQLQSDVAEVRSWWAERRAALMVRS